MSSPQSPTNTLSSRLAALAQRLGLVGRASRQVLEQASRLQLPFAPLSPLQPDIWWQNGPPLQRLVDLPRNALSGPVQEDKAQAHAVLVHLVEEERRDLSDFDLRLVEGIHGHDEPETPCPSFELYAATPACKNVRIISYKDFVKAISQPLPRFLAGERLALYQASWYGDRVFWHGSHHPEAFAAAVVYARRRQMEVTLPADLVTYRLLPAGLDLLDSRYHVLSMPVEAWSHAEFMALLMSEGIPYARLSLLKNRKGKAPEFLLLPKDNPEATALGEGLRLAGAADVVQYLRTLLDNPPALPGAK
ncbi:hypothetical protein WP8S17C03_16940 [Metapseudomonas otitidis]|uniref:Uncharacterized protein n=1 Tax=Metapseudomonas otitidis TaxID=319939 RepID=A0A6S5RRU8_9GAMM|nr:DUF6685 family protein [Pseudomonas otitidis]BBT15645.1 hypothetical protein WP8S17C03_16940 [Pseudomonas otitidis]